MQASSTIGALALALAKAQGAMPIVKKDKTAKIASARANYSYKYADLASVWEAARGPLSANGLAVVQFPRLEAGFLHVDTTLLHESGEYLESTMSIRLEADNDARALGTAITYLKRYALASAIGIVSDEDTDGEPSGAAPGNNGRRNDRAELERDLDRDAPAGYSEYEGEPTIAPYSTSAPEGRPEGEAPLVPYCPVHRMGNGAPRPMKDWGDYFKCTAKTDTGYCNERVKKG